MAKCIWREKPGSDENCPVMADAGEEYCPRHGFMKGLAVAKKDRKEGEKARAIGTRSQTNTRGGLLRLGYLYLGNDTCSGCGLAIEWWRTVPKLRRAPFDPMADENSVAVSHFATCKVAGNFRRANI